MTKIISLCVFIQISITFISSSTIKACNNGRGSCVPSNQCKNGQVNKEGDKKIFLNRFVDENDLDDEPVNSRFANECDIYETCCSSNEISDISSRDSDDDIFPLCGFRNVNGVGLLANNRNNEAKYGEFPWTLLLLKERYAVNQVIDVYICGSSLLSETVALTAAHCVKDEDVESLKLRAGEWDTSSTTEQLPHSEYRIKSTVIHEKFNAGNLQNDIALMFLDQPVRLSTHINRICLPPQDYNFNGNRNCILTGWGRNQYNNRAKFQNILKKFEAPMVSLNECQNRLRRTTLGIDFELHNSFLCAGNEHSDSCEGDGGGALICPIENIPGYYYQAGIVSWGIGCKTGNPSVYVNVAKYRTWIEEKYRRRYSPIMYGYNK